VIREERITFVKSHLLFVSKELPLSLTSVFMLHEGQRLLFVYKLGRIDV